MTQALDLTRGRFEATPRSLDDDELVRLARGDRGCLGDLVSGLGAVMLVSGAILGAMGSVSFNWAYVGCGVWIAGFVWGTWAQTRSGKQRKAALESGPLVMALVLRKEEWLGRPGKRPGRAVVLFSTAPDRRFDRAALDEAAAAIEASHVSGGGSGGQSAPWSVLLRDEQSFGLFPVKVKGAGEVKVEAEGELYLAALIVHPDRLEGDYLGYHEDLEASEHDLGLDTTLRAPVLAAIVEPTSAFIEQVPRAQMPAPPEGS